MDEHSNIFVTKIPGTLEEKLCMFDKYMYWSSVCNSSEIWGYFTPPQKKKKSKDVRVFEKCPSKYMGLPRAYNICVLKILTEVN